MRIRYLAVLVGALLIAPVTANEMTEEALRHVPSDAGLAIVVPSMDALAGGLVEFGKAAGIDELTTMDVRKELLAKLEGRTLGLDTGGAFVVVVKPWLLIGTLPDPAVFAKDVQGEDAGDGLIQFELDGRACFAGKTGRLGIIGADRTAVQSALEAKGEFSTCFEPDAQSFVDRGQIALLCDMQVWKPFFDPMLQVAEGFLDMGAAMAGDPDKTETSVAVWKWMFAQLRQILNESEVYALSVTVNADGVSAHDILTVDPGGVVAGWLGDIQKTKGDLFHGLPKADAAVVFASGWKLPEGRQSMSEQVLDAMLATPGARELRDDPKTQKAIEAAKLTYQKIGGNSGLVQLAAGKGLVVAGLYETDEPEVVLSALDRSLDLMTSAKLMGLSTANLDVSLKRSEDSIESVPVRAYELRFESPDEHIRDVLHAMYGEVTMYYAAVHPRGVAFAMGPAAGAKQAMKTLLTSEYPSLTDDPRIAAAEQHWSGRPQVAVLVDLPKVAELSLSVARATGAPMPEIKFDAKPSPYAAVGIYMDAHSLRGEIFVPASGVRAIATAIKSAKPKGDMPD